VYAPRQAVDEFPYGRCAAQRIAVPRHPGIWTVEFCHASTDVGNGRVVLAVIGILPTHIHTTIRRRDERQEDTDNEAGSDRGGRIAGGSSEKEYGQLARKDSRWLIIGHG
jgi:hypothetical protein